MTQRGVHISSMVVHALPDSLAALNRQISALRGTEIHGESASGKLVVVLESTDQAQITSTIDAINRLPGVLNTALVYHQIDAADSQVLDA